MSIFHQILDAFHGVKRYIFLNIQCSKLKLGIYGETKKFPIPSGKVISHSFIAKFEIVSVFTCCCSDVLSFGKFDKKVFTP
jgi:hypothetical protein